jgi:uncharacterized protein (TIRG00374 family)
MSKPKKHPVRSLIANALGVVLALGLLGWAVYQNRDKIRGVFEHGIDARLFALAFLVYFTGITLSFFRWFLLVRTIEPRFTLHDALLLGFIGNVFNLVIPGGVGGDFVKAAYLVKMDIKRTQAVASMVIDRIVGLLGLFLLGGVAGLFVWPVASRDIRVLIALVWFAVVSGLIVLGMIFNQSLTRTFPSLLEGHGRVAGILRELRELSETYRQRLGLVAALLVGSSGIHFLFVVAFYLASRAIFPGSLPGFGAHLVIVPLILFSTAVPLPFGALGVSEEVGQQLFRLVNHPSGALAMMAFRVLMYSGGLICVSVYLSHIKQVRALTDTAGDLEQELLEGELAP